MARTLLAGIRTVIAVPLFFVFTLILASVIIVISFLAKNSPLIDAVIRLWSRTFLVVAPVRLERGGVDLDPTRQYVFVANHLSNFDIPVMFLTAPVPIRYLAKKEIYRIPLVAQAMNRIGIIKTDRQAGMASHTLINEGVAAAKKRGHSLIIFPEGTRSDDGKLAPFKKGAFRIAIANRLPVVPVTIEGTWEVWPPGAKIFYPGRARTTLHAPIETAAMELTDITALRDRCHAVIAAALPDDAVHRI